MSGKRVSVMIAAFGLLAGCVAIYPEVDQQYGYAVTAAREAQTFNPQAGKRESGLGYRWPCGQGDRGPLCGELQVPAAGGQCPQHRWRADQSNRSIVLPARPARAWRCPFCHLVARRRQALNKRWIVGGAMRNSTLAQQLDPFSC